MSISTAVLPFLFLFRKLIVGFAILAIFFPFCTLGLPFCSGYVREYFGSVYFVLCDFAHFSLSTKMFINSYKLQLFTLIPYEHKF